MGEALKENQTGEFTMENGKKTKGMEKALANMQTEMSTMDSGKTTNLME